MKKSPPPLDKESFFSRRVFALGVGKAALVSLVLGRLYYLGGLRSGHYKTLANDNRIRLHLLMPKRGIIYDCHGEILAKNEPCYRLMFIRDQSRGHIRQTLRKLATLVDLEPLRIEDLRRRIKEVPSHQPVVLCPLPAWEDVCKIEMNTFQLPGVYVEEGSKRFYPYGFETAHLVGYVQTPSLHDNLEKSYLRCPDFRLGREGVEKTYDVHLRGRVGYQEVEVNALRKVVRKLSETKSESGSSLYLTIDIRLQKFIYERIQEHPSASVVVMDVHTGRVLGLVSNPSFDPNPFNEGISQQEWDQIRLNPYGILHNKSTSGVYPPGSLFKMVVALAGLESGVISIQDRVFCPGHLDFKGHRYHCWYNRLGHGSVDLVTALAVSCDVYFYVQSQKIGIDRIEAIARRFGFGQRTGIELPSEKEGLIPGRRWKEKHRGHVWTPGDTLLTSIGQGAVLATPLQMAVFMARLVNGGRVVEPRLFHTLSSSSENRGRGFRQVVEDSKVRRKTTDSLGLNPGHLAVIKEGMDRVVAHPMGIAYAHRLGIPSMEMGGKTGTSQVRRISLQERQKGALKNEALQWAQRDHALFAGYAPLHAPAFCVSVVVEHGGGGARTAAPIARDILFQTQKLSQKFTG